MSIYHDTNKLGVDVGSEISLQRFIIFTNVKKCDDLSCSCNYDQSCMQTLQWSFCESDSIEDQADI